MNIWFGLLRLEVAAMIRITNSMYWYVFSPCNYPEHRDSVVITVVKWVLDRKDLNYIRRMKIRWLKRQNWVSYRQKIADISIRFEFGCMGPPPTKQTANKELWRHQKTPAHCPQMLVVALAYLFVLGLGNHVLLFVVKFWCNVKAFIF